jgi:hypothetical protein
MTAVVSRERARATCLTGAAGVLMLAVAFVMMVVAAPGHVHGPAKPSVAQLTTDVGHQLTPRSDLEGQPRQCCGWTCSCGPGVLSARFLRISIMSADSLG